MWSTLAKLGVLWPSDAKLVLLATSGVSLKGLAKVRRQSLLQAIDDLEAALAQIAANLAEEQAA